MTDASVGDTDGESIGEADSWSGCSDEYEFTPPPIRTVRDVSYAESESNASAAASADFDASSSSEGWSDLAAAATGENSRDSDGWTDLVEAVESAVQWCRDVADDVHSGSEAASVDSVKPPKKGEKRCVYMFTFSWPTAEKRRNGHRTPAEFTRAEFGALLAEAYAIKQPGNHVVYYAVAQEQHKEGTDAQRNVHFHAVVKCARQHWYAGIVRWLRDRGVYVSASCSHLQYCTAFRYLVLPSNRKPKDELDREVFLSRGHPSKAAAATPTQSLEATLQASDSAADRGPEAEQKTKRIPIKVKVAEALVSLGIKTVEGLQAYARAERDAGKRDFYGFCLDHRDLDGYVADVWRIEAASAYKPPPMKVVREAAERACECATCGRWAEATKELLERNGIPEAELAAALAENLTDGPGKGLNVFLYGESNCGKSHCLAPLEVIFGDDKVMPKPDDNPTFAMETLRDFDVVLFEEFTYNKKIMTWDDLDLWLAAQPWGLARKGKKSIKYRPTQPVFFTGPHKLRHPTNDRRKETMMDNRMRYFKFDRPIVKVDRRIRPCARCFARWVLRLD